MATAAPITPAPAGASSNVTRLPTAAKRKPQNHRYVAQHYAAKSLREAQPWPGRSAIVREAC